LNKDKGQGTMAVRLERDKGLAYAACGVTEHNACDCDDSPFLLFYAKRQYFVNDLLK
jgi:hypothetical protein